MNILINGITLENANLTPLLINTNYWQSKGCQITFIGNQTLKRKIQKLNIISNFNFIQINHTKKITTKTQLITQGLKRNIQALKKIPQIKGRFNIIHSRSSVLDLIIFPFILKLIDKKIKWSTVFDNTVPPRPFFPHLLFRISLILLKKTDLIFTISPSLKRYLVRKNFQNSKIIVTGNGLETDLIKSSKNDPKLNFQAVFIGRIHQAKGIFDLIKILQIIKHKIPKFQLAIMGQGDSATKTKFKKAITKAGLNSNIHLLGTQTGKRKFQIIKSSKIFIFPSYNESFGIALLEAVCCGLPAFTYNLPAYKNIYKNHEIHIFPIGNYQKLAQAIIKAIKNKNFTNNQGKLLLNKYSWKKIAQIEYHSLSKLI